MFTRLFSFLCNELGRFCVSGLRRYSSQYIEMAIDIQTEQFSLYSEQLDKRFLRSMILT